MPLHISRTHFTLHCHRTKENKKKAKQYNRYPTIAYETTRSTNDFFYIHRASFVFDFALCCQAAGCTSSVLRLAWMCDANHSSSFLFLFSAAAEIGSRVVFIVIGNSVIYRKQNANISSHSPKRCLILHTIEPSRIKRWNRITTKGRKTKYSSFFLYFSLRSLHPQTLSSVSSHIIGNAFFECRAAAKTFSFVE